MATIIETREFASQQAGRLLGHLAFQISRTIKSGNADPVHEVIVAIRRFARLIAVCRPCFPGKDVRKIRRRLRKIIAAVGEVRHCDVVLKFIANLQSPDVRQIQSKLRSHRKDSSCILVNELKKWSDRQKLQSSAADKQCHRYSCQPFSEGWKQRY